VYLPPGQGIPVSLNLEGRGNVLVMLPQKIARVELAARPQRTLEGVAVSARVLGEQGVTWAALPLRIVLRCGGVTQTVHATTRDGDLSWVAPFLKGGSRRG
jgi:hypothetical protein